MGVKDTSRASQLDPFEHYLRAHEQHPLSAVRHLEEIKPLGLAGSIATLRRYLRTLKHELVRQEAHRAFRDAARPARQADWAHCGRFPNSEGKLVPVYAFVMVLCFSPRMLFVRFTESMRMRELVECHQEAFAFIGGWPHSILYANMKQVKLSAFQ